MSRGAFRVRLQEAWIEIRENLGRSSLQALGVMLGVAAVLGGFSITDSFRQRSEQLYVKLGGLDKLNVVEVKRRIKEIGKAKDDAEELAALRQWLALSEQEAELKKQLKALDAELDAKALAQYPQLSVRDIQALVVDDKWLAALNAAVQGEVERVSQVLTRRVKELAERYDTPLPQLAANVTELETKVAGHLAKMGFAWN